jgi:hypothetical protein
MAAIHFTKLSYGIKKDYALLEKFEKIIVDVEAGLLLVLVLVLVLVLGFVSLVDV